MPAAVEAGPDRRHEPATTDAPVPGNPPLAAPTPDSGVASAPSAMPARDLPVHRPILERLGMASIALVLAILFGAMAAASWVGHEPFLAIMAGIGALMTAWAGVITITRG